MDVENLKFAALLHDIGKFYQRTGIAHSDEYKNYDEKDYGWNGAHAKWSADFVKDYWNADVADLVLHHHNPGKSDLASMIQKADHHSSIEREKREDGDKGEVLKSLLVSVFSEISIEDNEKVDESYVPLRELKLNKVASSGVKKDYFEDIKPVKEMDGWNLKNEYRILWNKFIYEISGLKKHNDFNTVLAILRKYMFGIPSAAYVHKSDISLYDHSKTTSAIAIARYLFKRDSSEKLLKTKNDQKCYLAINGDISGIQNFIFKVSSPQDAQSGMSKRLRGRSLYLTLLNDALSSYIVEDLELSQANIIFSGGGRFTIIGPNTEVAKDKLLDLKKKINEFFIDKFNAELYLALVWQECSGEDFGEFGKVTSRLSNKLAEDKKHKFVESLDEVFDFDEEIKYEDLCSVCGKPYKKHEKSICSECLSHEKLGQAVANADYMIKIYGNDNDKLSSVSFDLLGIKYLFKNKSKNLASKISEIARESDKVEVIKLNDTDFLDLAPKVNDEKDKIEDDVLDKVSFSFSFLGNVIPNLGKYSSSHKYMPLYFEHLAQISRGSNKLGVLKMDVDNLGRIFSEGFRELNEEKSSISRISTLSSQMDIFFSGFVNNIASNYKVYSNIDENLEDKFDRIELKIQNDDDSESDERVSVYKLKYGEKLSENEEELLSKYEIPTIHINYSGGDDLLVLGPYDDILSFAEELKDKFKTWTCCNPSINLSAGINLVSSKFPIGKAANMAEEYLEASKSCGRNKITVFGETVNWNSNGRVKGFDELFKFANKLESYCDGGKLSKGIVYSMLNLWNNNYEYTGLLSDHEKWEDDVYNRLRTKRFVPLFKYKLRLIKDREIKEDLDKNGLKFMPWIKIPVSWVSLRMR